MRPIDADALIVELQKDEAKFDKEAEDCRKNSRNYTDCYMQAMSSRADGIRDAIIEVYDAPTIDAVEVVYGEWLDEHENGHGYWVGTCSRCGKEKRMDNFCPNCGADMRKENER